MVCAICVEDVSHAARRALYLNGQKQKGPGFEAGAVCPRMGILDELDLLAPVAA